MFIEIVNQAGNQILINVNKIYAIHKISKGDSIGISILLDDGSTPIQAKDNYDSILLKIKEALKTQGFTEYRK